MHITTLRYFLEISNHGSIRKAADNLNISPSAVSRQISILERSVDASLFERRSTGMILTAEGRAFLKYAHRTVRDIDLAQSEIDDIRGLRRGQVSITSVEGPIPGYLFSMIAEFRERYNSVQFDVFAASNDVVIKRLLEDQADIGIAFNPAPNSLIRTVLERRQKIAVVASPSHPLASKKNIQLNDLCHAEIAVLDGSFGTRHLLDKALRRANLSLEFALTINSVEMAKNFAARGFGVAILPAFVTEQECIQGKLVAIPINNTLLKSAKVTVCVQAERKLSRASSAFLEYMQARSNLL